MSRIVAVPNGDETDLVRVCERHEWASLPVPVGCALTPVECPACDETDEGRERYWRLLLAGALTGERTAS